jgi:ABC-type Mn2+/Zn2+ transport system ATPase subunit
MSFYNPHQKGMRDVYNSLLKQGKTEKCPLFFVMKAVRHQGVHVLLSGHEIHAITPAIDLHSVLNVSLVALCSKQPV